MCDAKRYTDWSLAAYTDAFARDPFMDYGIKELWPQIPRVVEPAYQIAKERTERDESLGLDAWEEKHHQKVRDLLEKLKK